MAERLTTEQLRNFASDLRSEMGANAFSALTMVCTLEFGCVRYGSLTSLWGGKPHPLVIVSQWVHRAPPALSLRPSTSKPHSGPGVLCLPAGAILMKKRGKSVVPDYVLCNWKLRAPTSVVEEMDYLNKLEEIYLNGLKKCLQEACQ